MMSSGEVLKTCYSIRRRSSSSESTDRNRQVAAAAHLLNFAPLTRAGLVLFIALSMPAASDEVAVDAMAPLMEMADTAPLGPPNAARGQQVYRRRCARCHAPDLNGDGPMHRGVVGRRAATVEGFNYSKALRESGLTWTDDKLDRWLADPAVLVPGQAMDVQVSNPQSRSDLIAYLRTFHD